MKKSPLNHGRKRPWFIQMTNTKLQQQDEQKIWVVFSGYTDLRWLKFLKSGFRHCFVLLHDGKRWICLLYTSPSPRDRG